MIAKTITTVEDAILESYLENKEPLSVPEIWEKVGGKLGRTIIRKVVSESDRIAITHKEARIFSKKYPTVVHQHRSVAAFQPTRKWLVDIINAARLELPHYKYDQKYRR